MMFSGNRYNSVQLNTQKKHKLTQYTSGFKRGRELLFLNKKETFLGQ